MPRPNAFLVPIALLTTCLAACSDDAALGEVDSSSSGSSSSGAAPSESSSGSTDGMSTTMPVETSEGPVDGSSSSGAPPDDCGNGDLDEGEQCDDGNLDDGDDCRADCTLAFEVAWTQLYNGPASNADAISALWIDQAGNAYVLGSHRTVADGDDLWLQQYLPDGSAGLSFTLDGAFGGDDRGIALAPASNGDLLLVGRTEIATDDSDAWVVRIAPTLDEVVWQSTFAGPGIAAVDDSASALLPGSDDGLVVGGFVSIDDQGVDAWIARLDEGGVLLWEATFDDELHLENDTAAVLPTDEGGVIVFGPSRDTFTRAGFAQRYDAEGVPQGDPTTFDYNVREVVPDGEGGFVLAGFVDTRNTVIDATLRKIDGELVEQWAVDWDGSLDFDFGNGLALDGAGNAYLVGQTSRVGQQDNGFIAAFDQGGNPLWGDEYNTDDIDLGDGWQAVATDADGDVVVVGYATLLGHQTDGFVRKYHPL